MNLHFLRVFLLDIEFWVDSLVPVGSGLPVSDKKKKICSQLSPCSHTGNISFSSGCFQNFFLGPSFSVGRLGFTQVYLIWGLLKLRNL